MFSASVCLLISLIVWARGSSILRLLQFPPNFDGLWLAPVLGFLGTLTLALDLWLIRKASFSRLAKARVLRSTTSATSQLALGFYMPSYGLMWGAALGALQTIALQVVWIGCRAPCWPSRPELRRLRQTISEYRDFPSYSLAEAAVGQLQPLLLIVSITIGYSPILAGYYVLANRLALAPVSIWSNATSSVCYASFVELQSDHLALRAALRVRWSRTLLFAIPFATSMAVAVGWLVERVLGHEWAPTASLIPPLLPLVIATAAFQPTSAIAVVTRQQRASLLWAGSALLLKLSLLSVLAKADIVVLVSSWSAIDAVSMLTLNLWIYSRLSSRKAA